MDEIETGGVAQALDQLVGLARESRKPILLNLPGTNEIRVFDRDGVQVEQVIAPRRHTAHTISGLADVVADLAVREITDDVRVFVGRGCVKAVLNEDGDRNDTVTMELEACSSMETLLKADKDGSFKQRDLIWLLRSQFSAAIKPESFLPDVRGIKFRNDSKGTSGVQHGRETVDLSVEKTISGINDQTFPETIELQTPVFEQLATSGFKAIVTCAVDILVDEGSFRIKPVDGEIERAYDEAARFMSTSLAAELAQRGLRDGESNVVIYTNAAFGVA